MRIPLKDRVKSVTSLKGSFCLLVGWLVSVFSFFVFGNRVSLYSLGYPGTQSIDHAGLASLQPRDPPASASRVLALMVCATIAWPLNVYLNKCFPQFLFLFRYCQVSSFCSQSYPSPHPGSWFSTTWICSLGSLVLCLGQSVEGSDFCPPPPPDVWAYLEMVWFANWDLVRRGQGFC